VLIVVLLAVFAGLQLKAALAPQDATAVALGSKTGACMSFFSRIARIAIGRSSF
jgi:hypothetical protein